MIRWLAEILLNIFKNKRVATLFVSAFPLVELKGAIPIGKGLFSLGLSETALLAYLGSTAAGILVFFLLEPIFKLLKKIKGVGRFILKVETVLDEKAEKIAKKAEGKEKSAADDIKTVALFLFVAVPLPVTGVWTGAAIAAFLGVKFYRAIPAISLGNLVAGAIITLLTFLFEPYVDIIIYALLAVVIIMLTVAVIKVIRAKPDENKEDKNFGNGDTI